MLVFVLMLVGLIYTIFSIYNQKDIEDNVFNTTKIVAQKVDIKIQNQLVLVETLTKSLANLALSLDTDKEKNKQIIKNLLDLKGYETFIAGGGIWPEPYMLDKTKEKDSYFFARNQNKVLEFYDDYNHPEDDGYYHREWYVPAKFYKKGQIYWSKSYIDPYSFEPMVTATAPIYKDDKFIGVATVDVMLNGLQKLLKVNIEDLGGYGFILDRNYKIIAFPQDDKLKVDNDYLNLDGLVKLYPAYKEIFSIKKDMLLNHDDKKIIQKLKYDSNDIDTKEAKNILSLIKDVQKKTDSEISLKIIKNDPKLQEKCLAISIHQQNTHWTLVVIMPLEIVFSKSNAIFNNLIVIIFLLVCLFAFIGYFAIRRSIITPIVTITKELDEKTVQLEEINKTLNQKVKEEVEKNLQKDKKMLAQSRLAQMGEMISMIAHQWRQPLNAISTTIYNLELKFELEEFDLETKDGREEQERYFIKRFSNIDDYIKNLTQTIDDFRNFYKPNKNSVSTTLDIIVEKSLHIIETSFKNSNIEVEINSEELKPLKIYDSELMQVILNILKNSQDNFKEKDIKNPKINIDIFDNSIVICDNGGGIKDDILGKVFDPYFSTKDEKNGTGIGLYMSKIIVEEHHHGELSAHNYKDGVCFSIILKGDI